MALQITRIKAIVNFSNVDAHIVMETGNALTVGSLDAKSVDLVIPWARDQSSLSRAHMSVTYY